MNYNFEFAVSAQISAKVVEEMVRKVVEEQTGKKVATITHKLGRISKGMGPSASEEYVFDGFFVTFLADKTTESNPSSFSKDKY